MRDVARRGVKARKVFQLSVSDIVQNAILAANRDARMCKAESLGELKAWLRQIVLHDISNAVRDLLRQKRDVRKEEQIQNGLPPVAKQLSPATEAIRNEDQRLLENAISQLPADNQQVIRLRHQEDRKFVDIAQIMGRSPDAARMLWNRSIAMLSREMKKRPAGDSSP